MAEERHWLESLIDGVKTDYPLSTRRPDFPDKPQPARRPRFKHGTKRSNKFEVMARELMPTSFFGTAAHYVVRAIYISKDPLTVERIVQEVPEKFSEKDIKKALAAVLKAAKKWHWAKVRKTESGRYKTVR